MSDNPATTEDNCTSTCREDVQRYQKLAGASVVIAQRRADAAEEIVAHTRAQVHHLRRAVKFSWIGAGTALLLCITLLVGFGLSSNAATARADVAETIADEARDELWQAKKQRDTAVAEAEQLRGKLMAHGADQAEVLARFETATAELARERTDHARTRADLDATLTALRRAQADAALPLFRAADAQP